MPASEERSISEFPSALSILATTLLLVSTYDSGNDAYDSEKVTAVDLASAILGDFEFTQDLFTNVKTIFGAINSIMCLYGNTVPSSSQGTDGQFYVKYTSSGGVDTVDGLYWKINDDWVEVSTGGGGGGATVTLGTTVPSDASGSNGDLYVQYDGTTYAVIEYFVKINGSWRKAPYSRVVALTQAEYDLITPDTTTLYIITDAQSSYQTKTDANLDTTATTVVGAINELKSDADANFNYTANETVIGDYFGLPLYRKYFEIGNLPNNTTKTVEILDFTIRDVIDFRCIAKTTNNQSMVTLPYVSTQAAFNILCDIECTNNKTKVNITTQMDRSGMVAFGIIDYLKWN